ncbi:MAG: Guanylate kinase [candidate division TM6 bacterium GW2011_GWF2_37_49]|nr:MAG: Guanylate kinase [candidate division TM6 bacterium GW2011_GWF2_37_49]
MLKNAKLKGKLFIIAAPSGAGKTSVTAGVVKFLQNLISIEKVITFTTRKPRTCEVFGKDYNFISTSEFLALKNEHYFLETTEYDGNYYGSPATIISKLKSGKSLIMISDRAGAKNFKNNILPDSVTIWLTVPSIEALRQRLEQRNTEDKTTLYKRVQIAENEIAQEADEPFFQYHVLNDDLEKSIRSVAKIIQQEISSKSK